MALVNGGLLALYRHKEILKKSFSLKPAGQILKLFHRDVPWVTYRVKKMSAKFFCQETWL